MKILNITAGAAELRPAHVHEDPLAAGPSRRPNARRTAIPKLVLAAMLAIPCHAWSGAIEPVSQPKRTNQVGSAAAFDPLLSSDGQHVVFVSSAQNLATNSGATPYLKVFLRDLAGGDAVLVSANAGGTGGGNADANSPSVSADARFVAFASAASDLVTGDTNGASDIFLRDHQYGTTLLVSQGIDGNSATGADTAFLNRPLNSQPILSADGRWVVFESLATNLVPQPDNNRETDLYLRDAISNRTFLVSVNEHGDAAGSGRSYSPSLTPDGRWVAFVSQATDLAPGGANALEAVFVRDRQSATTVCASTNVTLYFSTSYRCYHPVISDNGQWVSFLADAANGSPALVFRHDLQSGQTTLVASNAPAACWPHLSTTGRFMSYENGTNVYVRDDELGTNLLVSVNADATGPANAPSHTSVLTADGSRAIFVSAATDLVTNAVNGESQLYLRDFGSSATILVSANPAGQGTGRNMDVSWPAVSADGQTVVFESEDSDLVDGDNNRAADIFQRNLNTGTIVAVSARAAELPARTGVGQAMVAPGGISADGRFVAFTSFDSDLVAGDTNRWPDIFLRDQSTGGIQLVSGRADDGIEPGPIWPPVVSADGRYVAFARQSTDVAAAVAEILRWDRDTGELIPVPQKIRGVTYLLQPDFTHLAISPDGGKIAFDGQDTSYFRTNVFLMDLATGEKQLVSADPTGSSPANGDSHYPVFSPDGRWLTFQSRATDLVTNTLNTAFRTDQLFALDLQQDRTILVSLAADGSGIFGNNTGAVFSADSKVVAFTAANAYNSGNRVYAHQLDTEAADFVCSNGFNPTLSGDGRWIAYELPRENQAIHDIVAMDRQTGETNLVSVNREGTAGGNDSSFAPSFSRDGRYVVFASRAGDLVENDTNVFTDVFVRDVVAGTTLLVSLNRDGTTAGQWGSSAPVLAADGRTVAFASFSGDLADGDYNEMRDVFVLRLGAGDSDGDGLDDDWEVGYFGNLDRDGSGDFDGDGATDAAEFAAGTNPNDNQSVLRALLLDEPDGGHRILWSAAPGRQYQVQYKDDLDNPDWINLGEPVVASGTAASAIDIGPSTSRRFYRILLMP